MWRNTAAPTADVQLPALESGTWLAGLSVYMAAFSHQVAVATVMHGLSTAFPAQSWRSPDGALWPDGTPVHLRYRWYADDPGDFYGYVASSRVLASENDPRYAGVTLIPVEYTCVGATMPMQTHVNKCWQDATGSYMARTIARGANLLPWVETSTTHFDQRMQAASDWKFLSELAGRCAYRLWADGTTLHFVKQSTFLPSSDGSVPVFWMRKAPGVVDGLRQFSAVLGDTDPDGGVRTELATTALNAQSGVMSRSTYTPPRTTRLGVSVPAGLTSQYGALPAADYASAQQMLYAAATYLWVQARAVTNGDTRLKPGALVELQGDGLSETHQGTWMVKEAVHRISVDHFSTSRTDYTTSLLLGRNNAAALHLPAQTVRAPRDYGTTLTGGTWRAVSIGGL